MVKFWVNMSKPKCFTNFFSLKNGYLSLHLCYFVVTGRVKLASVPAFSQFWHIGGRNLEILLMIDCLYSCSLLTFVWFQGNRNLVWGSVEIAVPIDDCDYMRKSLWGQVLSWSFYFCLLSWIHYHGLPWQRKGKPECLTGGFQNFAQIICAAGNLVRTGCW